MAYTVDNAIILAAGTSSRFAPLSYERPKALITVKGEILIERQIRQLQQAGVPEIFVVTGYRSEQLVYLADKFGVKLVHNPDYGTRNNNASLYAARRYLGNSYVCSADNYFCENPFEREVDGCYYAAVYANGPTQEWCIKTDAAGNICGATVGGRDSWYMMGHTFWDTNFSQAFVEILEEVYYRPETAPLLWESIFLQHTDRLKMKVRQYAPGIIYEFDSLDELRQFDPEYRTNSHSTILREIAVKWNVPEEEITGIRALAGQYNDAVGFCFQIKGQAFYYDYFSKEVSQWNENWKKETFLS